MKVYEIKAKFPEVDVYALDEDAKYLVVADSTKVNSKTMEAMLKFLPKGAVVLSTPEPENAIRLFEIIG